MREYYFLELNAKVAVNDVYITELEEENEKVEKQYRKEKQITKGINCHQWVYMYYIRELFI